MRYGKQERPAAGPSWLVFLSACPAAGPARRPHRPTKHSSLQWCAELRSAKAQQKARQHMMPQLRAAARVKQFGLHAIRHLAATIMSYSGEMSLSEVQTMLRQKNQHYSEVYQELECTTRQNWTGFCKKKGREDHTLRARKRSNWHII